MCSWPEATTLSSTWSPCSAAAPQAERPRGAKASATNLIPEGCSITFTIVSHWVQPRSRACTGESSTEQALWATHQNLHDPWIINNKELFLVLEIELRASRILSNALSPAPNNYNAKINRFVLLGKFLRE